MLFVLELVAVSSCLVETLLTEGTFLKRDSSDSFKFIERNSGVFNRNGLYRTKQLDKKTKHFNFYFLYYQYNRMKIFIEAVLIRECSTNTH